MARTKTQPAELVPDTQLNPELENTQNLIATVSSEFSDERDLLNQLLGQAQMADAFAQFSVTVTTSKLAFVKENKLYRALSGRKTGDGHQFSGTWEEFCSLLNRSREQIDEDIRNLRSLGEEALESMSRMGIGYRELRQFRRLPEDQKSALIEVARDGDKTALLELAEEMIARHAKEKEALAADLEVSRQTLAEKKDQVNSLIDEKEALETQLKRRIASETPADEGAAIETELLNLKNTAVGAVALLGNGLDALDKHTDRTGIPHAPLMTATLDAIQFQLEYLRQQYGLDEYRTHNEIPDWVKEAHEGGNDE